MKEHGPHVGLVHAQGRGRGARRGRLPWRDWTALHMRRHRQKAAPHIAGMPSQGPRQRVGRVLSRVRTVRSRESEGGARIAEHAHSRHGAPSQCTFHIAARGRMSRNTRARNAHAPHPHTQASCFGGGEKGVFFFCVSCSQTQHAHPATARTLKAPHPAHCVCFLQGVHTFGPRHRLRAQVDTKAWVVRVRVARTGMLSARRGQCAKQGFLES